MSEQVVVRCPSCGQKYRIPAAAVGRRARCAKCSHAFVLGTSTTCDEDTILSWITEADPASESVMGSTGLFHPPDHPADSDHGHSEPQPAPAERSGAEINVPGRQPAGQPARQLSKGAVALAEHHESHVRLVRVDDDGACFEFPVSAVTNEALRDSFPRKCVGCGSKHGLLVHLVHWPDRMRGHDAVHWKEYQAGQVGEWDTFSEMPGRSWLRRIPSATRHTVGGFNLPFPFLLCRHCNAGAEVQARIVVEGRSEVCRLTIRSLAAAVDFFRNNGGRHTSEYQQLIEQRNIRHDRRNELSPEVRARLSHWFVPLPGEQFVHYFPDAEFSPAEEGNAGAVLTVRRLVFKKFAAYRDYSLHAPCRVEVKCESKQAVVQIFEQGHRPAALSLTEADASQLVFALQSLNCHWQVVR